MHMILYPNMYMHNYDNNIIMLFKSGRVVASRYLSGPKNPPSRLHTGNTSAVLTAATSSNGKTHKADRVSSIHHMRVRMLP